MNFQEIIADLNGALAQAQLERMRALEHLFSILDGKDRETAIVEARAWMKKEYGDAYEMVSAVCQRVLAHAGAVEWPDEL